MAQEKLDINDKAVSQDSLIAHTSEIAAAYFSHHTVDIKNIQSVIEEIYEGLLAVSSEASDHDLEPAQPPAVPIAESLKDDVIICLEDGLSFQSLKRHLRVKYDMTPEAYRKKWGLPLDYPMVAPAYARRRSELAKRTGLGKNRL